MWLTRSQSLFWFPVNIWKSKKLETCQVLLFVFLSQKYLYRFLLMIQSSAVEIRQKIKTLYGRFRSSLGLKLFICVCFLVKIALLGDKGQLQDNIFNGK